MGTLTERGRSVARGVFAGAGPGAAPASTSARTPSPGRHDRHVRGGVRGSSRAGSSCGRSCWPSSSCSPTPSTAPWPGCPDGRRRGAPSSTPPSTGSPTRRCSAAIALYYAGLRTTAGPVAGSESRSLASSGSGLVSYARARAEGIGIDASVGLAERTERLVIVGAGVLLAGVWDVRCARGWRWPSSRSWPGSPSCSGWSWCAAHRRRCRRA